MKICVKCFRYRWILIWDQNFKIQNCRSNIPALNNKKSYQSAKCFETQYQEIFGIAEYEFELRIFNSKQFFGVKFTGNYYGIGIIT